MATFPARLHVLLARDAPIGLVIRRGPAKQVATLLWNRANNEFMLGQWMKGRIYERKCDLSPDGKYFIYFALDGNWQGESQGTLTAISIAPYLKAIAFYPKGDTYNGGGLFTGVRSYWLNDGHLTHTEERATAEVIRDLSQPTSIYGDECRGVYFPRLIRDGWSKKESFTSDQWEYLVTFEKSCSAEWVLRKLAHNQSGGHKGTGSSWDEHVLLNKLSGVEQAFPKWEWADMDGDRLVWATEGRLETGRLQPEGITDQRVLFDFNELSFSAIKAPY